LPVLCVVRFAHGAGRRNARALEPGCAALRTRDITRVAESRPVDRVARRLLAPGVHYEPTYKPSRETRMAPPKTSPFPGQPADDLTGTRCGRLRVVGYLRPNPNPSKGAVWLVRCDCGNFEQRSKAAIQRKHVGPDRCEPCGVQLRFKRRLVFERTGKWPADGWEP
jgi:hypothetical protein